MKQHRKVILLDDDEVAGYLHEHIVSQLDLFEKILVLSSCEDLIEEIKRDIPDLILLDISLPSMDGFDFLERLEMDERCNQIPIVMITSSVRTVDRERALKFSNVFDFVKKPLTLAKMRATMLNFNNVTAA